MDSAARAVIESCPRQAQRTVCAALARRSPKPSVASRRWRRFVRLAAMARSTPWSAKTAPASRHSSRSSPAPTSRTAARSKSTADSTRRSSRTRPRQLGIGVVYQEFNLLPELSVAENIFLGAQPTGRFGLLDIAERRRRTLALLDRLGAHVDPDRLVKYLTVASSRSSRSPRRWRSTRAS